MSIPTSRIRQQRIYVTKTGAKLKVVRIRKKMVTYIRPDVPGNFQNTIPIVQFASAVDGEIAAPLFPAAQVGRNRSYELRSGRVVRVVEMFTGDKGEQMLKYVNLTGVQKDLARDVQLKTFARSILRRLK